MKHPFDYSDADIISMFRNVDWSFADEKTAVLSHNIHPYPAKFIPQVPRNIMRILSEEGDTVWDVFGGSGSTALEAMFMKRNCISTDINPVGTLIGKVKTSPLTPDDKEQVLSAAGRLERLADDPDDLKSALDSSEPVLEIFTPNIPKMDKWFNTNVRRELAYIRSVIELGDTGKSAADLMRAALSRTVGIVSNQESETMYRAVDRDIGDGKTIRTFVTAVKTCVKKIEETDDYLRAINVRREDSFRRFITADVSAGIVGEEGGIAPESVDLIVTSPPYPNALDYYYLHRFRIFWLGGDPRKISGHEIGSHINYQKSGRGFVLFEEEMSPVLDSCRDALKPGRLAALVLGDALFFGNTYDTAQRLGVIAVDKGFDVVGIIERPLHGIKRSVMSKRIHTEKILILRKK